MVNIVDFLESEPMVSTYGRSAEVPSQQRESDRKKEVLYATKLTSCFQRGLDRLMVTAKDGLMHSKRMKLV